MRNRWSVEEAAQFTELLAPGWGEDRALQAYCSHLLGAEKELAVPGGASVSIKGARANVFGETVPAIFMMPSGAASPAGDVALDLLYLRRLCTVAELADEELLNELRTHRFDFHAPEPPAETLAHAFLPAKYIIYAQSSAVLALADRAEGGRLVRETLGEDVAVLPYSGSALELARAAAEAARPGVRAVACAHRGILTWGETACAAYASLADLLARAEEYRPVRASATLSLPTTEEVEERVRRVAPMVRGLLAHRMRDETPVPGRVIVRALTHPAILELLASEDGRKLAAAPPLAGADLLKPFPLAVDVPDWADTEKLRAQLSTGMDEFADAYSACLARHGKDRPLDLAPRLVLLPGLGALCAGTDVAASAVVRDVAEAMLGAKARLAGGECATLSEAELFRTEYGAFSRGGRRDTAPLAGRIALVTGAAGAIGGGICEGLLRQGCAVALGDLPGERLTALYDELHTRYGELAMALPFDVAEPAEVAGAFSRIVLAWGGVDLMVVNAGIAHVSSLADMKLEAFRRLERVNVEGTLNLLSEAGRYFRHQNSGGDVVLISTKNVFAPGAKFGAYSATKAAAHQLARIASLEFAELGVRVNMVAPDAVFGKGTRRSGLWAEVGADRARALGLTADELETYYRRRCLLKAEVTANHVANAVIYFATYQSPTTGATLPVDGGLPDATPR